MLCVLLLSAVWLLVTPAAAQLGRVLFWDDSDCYNVSPFFKLNGRGTISLYRNGVRIQGPFVLGRSNEYGEVPGRAGLRLPGNLTGSFQIKLNCGSATYSKNIDPTDIPLRDIVILTNKSPYFPQADLLGFDGSNWIPVRQIAPGSTLKVKFTVAEPDASGANPQPEPTLQVKSIYGSLSMTSRTHPSSVTWDYEYRWKIPNAPGIYDVYLSVNDKRGGYSEVALKVDAEAAGLLSAFPPEFDGLQPSDHVSQPDHFLTFFSTNATSYANAGADSARSSCAYYVDLGFATGCSGDAMASNLTFQQWRKKWGFSNQPPANGNQIRAVYANLADLNLERAMNAIFNADGAAFYVCNFPFEDPQLGDGNRDITLSRAINGRSLVACVAMEYSVTPGRNGGQPFTKFLVFSPMGNLIRPVNLDGRGMKFVPGACVVCHGATAGYSRYAEAPGTGNPAFGASFLPFDLSNYHFSILAGYGRADQEVALRKLNRYVRDHTDATPATRQLIDGWYPTPSSTFRDDFVPPGWAAAPGIYRKVVKPACRTCHVATRLPFNTKTDFDLAANLMKSVVCGNYGSDEKLRYAMPNARQTFDRFWTSTGGEAGVDQPAALRNYLRTTLDFPSLSCYPP